MSVVGAAGAQMRLGAGAKLRGVLECGRVPIAGARLVVRVRALGGAGDWRREAVVATGHRGAFAYAVSREGPWDEESSEVVSSSVIEAALRLPTPTAGEEIDRLAALAYQAGRYDAAERLTAKTDRPLGLWIRAKLALRHSDREAAVRDWTAALLASQKAGDANDLDDDTRVRLLGETAVAKLSETLKGQKKEGHDAFVEEDQ